ncbi:hypothetical protein GX645_07360 [Candidatus Sumerlaeota bacterium]|nr:hypothetical protein [Candidatus Sumerlaeales bacterium]NLD62254.1 hypothetical protein [Candidatus Sumerlaeota bacterium]
MKRLIISMALVVIATCACAKKPEYYNYPTSPTDTAPDVSKEVMQTLMDAKKAGQTLSLGDDITTDLPRIPWQAKAGGPQMFFSDDPEYIRVPEGIAAVENVQPGTVRIYQYNCSQVARLADGYTSDSKVGTPITRKISLVIENLGKAPLELKWKRYSYPEPSKNYHQVAKDGMAGFFDTNKKMPASRTIPVDAMEPLDANMEKTLVEYDALSHAFHEIEISQPARLYVVQCDPETNSVDAAKRAAVIESPKANAGRGLFRLTEYEIENAPGYVIDSARGPVQLMVAEGEIDPWTIGMDTTKGTFRKPNYSRLAGNYGVLYKCKLKRQSSDGRGLAMLTWNIFKQSMWCGSSVLVVPQNSKGKFPTGNIPVPSDKLGIQISPEASILQILPPVPKGKTEEIDFIFTPPGACCLPMPILFVPVDWKK